MATDDFFRARLDQMIDLRHPLAVLELQEPWAQRDLHICTRQGRALSGFAAALVAHLQVCAQPLEHPALG